ncbi:MATE family efflux transporter [Cyanobacteria bacterium FACHB-471]|nr:MATE family efflux transporter [Cyanobacteria bacterium FACHB-471]
MNRNALTVYSKSRILSEIWACLLLAVPLAAAQLAQAGTAFVDTVMMGLIDSQTLAAGGLGAVIFSTLLLVCTGVVAAVGPLVAEAYGAGNPKAIGRIAQQGLWLSLVLSLPCMLLIWHGDSLLLTLGQEPDNAILAGYYLKAVMWGFFPAIAFATLKNFVAALSRPRSVMVIMLCGLVFNGIANYVLMFGKLGFPALGLAGIGWASSISLWGMLIALVSFILSQRVFAIYQVFHHFRFESKVFWEVVQTGWPIGVLTGVETGLFAITAFLMGHLGTTTLAAHQIALQTAALTFMIPLGVSYATTVRVGQLVGQGDPLGARLSAYVGLGLGGTFMSLMAIAFWIFPEAITSVYIDVRDPANAAVVQVAKALLGVAAMFQLIDGIQIIAAGALRGLKDTRTPMLIGIFSYWVVGLISGYVLGFRLNLDGVGLWWGLALGLLSASVIFTWRFNVLIAQLIRRSPTPSPVAHCR